MSREIIVHATNFVHAFYDFVQRPVCQRPVETLTSSRKTIQSHRSSMIYREFNQDLPWKRDTLVAHPRARNSPAKFNFLPSPILRRSLHRSPRTSAIIISPLTFSIPSTAVRWDESTCWPHRFPSNPVKWRSQTFVHREVKTAHDERGW